MNSASKRKEKRKKNLQTDDPFNCEYKREREKENKNERSVNETSTCHRIVELYKSTTTTMMMIRKEDKH